MLAHGHNSTKVLNGYKKGKYPTSYAQQFEFSLSQSLVLLIEFAAQMQNEWDLTFL